MTNITSLESPPNRYGLKQVVQAELIKISSLRSTMWTLLTTLVGSIAVTVVATSSVAHHNSTWYQGFDPTNQAMSGLALATLAIGVLGVLAVTGEYGTGTIRSSLTAAPRRPLLLASKVIVVGGVSLVLGEALTFACFGIGQAVLSGGGAPTANLGQPGVIRALVLSGVFLALLGLLGLGLGVIIRHTAGALAGYVGFTFLVPLLLQRIPGDPGRFTPVPMLANSVTAVVPHAHQVSAPVALTLMILYSATVLGIAAVMIVRRDA